MRYRKVQAFTFSLGIWIFNSSCSSLNTREVVSVMDGLVQTRLPHGLDQTTSAGIQFYQKWLAAGLATRCTQMPSDSQYAQQSFQKCGAIVGTFKAMARVIQEPSASELGLPVLVQNQQIYFFDPLESCEIF